MSNSLKRGRERIVPIWYLWVGFTFYADRFETEEALYRVPMFAGMLAVTGFDAGIRPPIEVRSYESQ